jgi:hypothetical protein
VIHRVEDATPYVLARRLDRNEYGSVAGRPGTAADREVDLMAGARKLQELNDQLRQNNAWGQSVVGQVLHRRTLCTKSVCGERRSVWIHHDRAPSLRS